MNYEIKVELDEIAFRKKILDNEIKVHFKNYNFSNIGEPLGYYVGDKIIINKNMGLYRIQRNKIKELITINKLNGMVATIESISELFIQVDINGRKANFETQTFNPEIIEREYKQDFREDLLNIADDIDGVLLKNINSPTELLQKGI